jgi:guanine deaminase
MYDHESRLREAVRLAQENHRKGGRPFGAVLAFGEQVVATGVNEIIRTHDISAHAEMGALREACRLLERPNLAGGVMYASGQPCPMCLAAMVLAGIKQVYYAFGNEDAAPYGFSSAQVYEALHLQLPVALPLNKLRLDGLEAEDVYGPKAARS